MARGSIGRGSSSGSSGATRSTRSAGADFANAVEKAAADRLSRSKRDFNRATQRDVTGARSGGPGQTREVARTTPAAATAAALPGIGTQPPAEALRTATDLQNYFSDLQNIALGGQAAQSALARFGIAPEQSYFQYRGSFPEFGDLSGTSGGLAGIIRSLGKMSRTPESFAEGGRVGESMGRRNIQTDVGKFGQMLRDLMLMTDEPTGRQAERLAMAKEAGYVSPAIAQREGALYQPGGLMPRVAETIEVSPLPSPSMSREMTQRERELSRVRRMSQAERDLMEAIRNEPDITEEMLRDLRSMTDEPTGMSREMTQRERELSRSRRMSQAERDLMEAVRNEPDITEEMLRDLRSMTDEPTGMSREMTQREREYNRRLFLPDILDRLMLNQGDKLTREAVRNEPDITEVMPPVSRRPFPGLLLDNPQRTVTVEEMIRDMMESRGLTQEEAVKELQAVFRRSYPMSDTVPDYSFAGGGSVRGRRDALPMIEGDHVVPAHAVKGNEGGLASLSRRLSGNPSYDGMIRGPGGPRDDAIKTRVYAAGGGISGMMDNLQNPFNSVPARVSNKEYVIPRDAINNLGRMAGAPEGMANKAGQDIIYQLVENLKRKA